MAYIVEAKLKKIQGKSEGDNPKKMLKNMEAIRQGHMNSFLQADGNPFSEIDNDTCVDEVIRR